MTCELQLFIFTKWCKFFHTLYSSVCSVQCSLFCYLFPFCVEFYKIFRNETIASVFDVAVLVLLQRIKNLALFLPIKVNPILTNDILHQNLLCFPPPIIDTDFGEDNPPSKYYDDHKCYINLQNNWIVNLFSVFL